jgi:alginate O-acetyltransferase complex protein AlgI
MLGYRLAQNFNMPYLAVNISEFWHRWHMSLSSWLRDYLFIPLGGSRGTALRTARNLMITMTLGGLWHGANWTFVIWGAVHGLLLIVHRTFRSWCQARPHLNLALQTLVGTGLRVAATFLCVICCWVLFRAQSLTQAGLIFGNLLAAHGGLSAPVPAYVMLVTGAGLALGHLLTASGAWRNLLRRLPAPALGCLYALGINLVLMLAADTSKTFIYFQF